MIQNNLDLSITFNSPVPKSLSINGKILSNKKIADIVLEKKIPLRNHIIEVPSSGQRFLWENNKNLSPLDNIALYGLNWVENLLDAYNETGNELYIVTINFYIGMFYEWLKDDYQKLSIQQMDSYYNRTCVLTRLLKELGGDWRYYSETVDLLYFHHIDWLSGNSNVHSIGSNIILNYSLLVLSELFKHSDKAGKSYDISTLNIKNLLRSRFDEDGLPFGNSPSHYGYYLNLLSHYVKFADNTGKSNAEIANRFNTGMQSLACLTQHNGQYPMLGHTCEQNSIVQTLNNSHWFRSSGVAVLKDEDIYCMFKCGSSSPIYRHADDLSIILSYKNREIFCDSGNFSSDLSDKQLLVESCKGHSSITTQDLLNLNVKDYLTNIQSELTKIDEMSNDSISSFIEGTVSTTKNEIVKRKITYDRKKMIIDDSWSNVSSEKINIRFNLHLDSNSVEMKKGVITFFNKGLLVHLAIIALNNNYEIEIDQSLYCFKSNTANSSKAINIKIPAGVNGSVRFEIKFDESELINYSKSEEMFLSDNEEKQLKASLSSVLLTELSQLSNFGATELYRLGRKAYVNHDYETSKKCEILNKILHGCSIKSTCKLGKGTKIAYGGIGVLIHFSSEVGKYCTIGSNVTLASSPIIDDFVYIATGARLIKPKLRVGAFSIIGANAVINGDIEPFSIVGGVPAKVIKKITPDNIDKYLASYFATTDKTNPQFVDYVRKEFFKYYEECMIIDRR